jgi:Helix-turn-helix domain
MEQAKAITQRKAMWGDGLASGFVSVPTLLVNRQVELDICAQEMIVLLNLIGAWWQSDNLPYPRTATIAQRSGLSVRAVQRYISALEKKKLISRLRNQRASGGQDVTVTRYDLDGLVTKLQELSRIPQRAMVPSAPRNDDYLAGAVRTNALVKNEDFLKE